MIRRHGREEIGDEGLAQSGMFISSNRVIRVLSPIDERHEAEPHDMSNTSGQVGVPSTLRIGFLPRLPS